MGTVNVVSTLEATIALFHAQAASRGAQLTVSIPDDLTVWSDPDGLTHIVSNLLENALLHNPGRVDIRLGASAVGEHALISVSDDGKGIPDHLMDSIFERFVQGERDDGDGYRGTGLGLALARSVAQRVGGTIVVESEPEQGATFSLRVPLARPRRSTLEQMALEKGLLSPSDVRWAEHVQQTEPEKREIHEILVDHGALSTEERDTLAEDDE